MKNITRKLLAVLSAAVMVCLLIPVGTVAAAQFTDPIVNGGFFTADYRGGWASFIVCNST